MPKIIASPAEWAFLSRLASHYTSGGLAEYIYSAGFYSPTNSYAENDKGFVRKQCYEVLAELLGIPHEYLTDSRYPSKDYSLDKRLLIPFLGFVRFIIYPVRQAPGGSGFLRFYLECPLCGKKCAVGRFHQHIGGHQNEATLLNERECADMGTDKCTEYKYLLKRSFKAEPNKRYGGWAHTVYIREESHGYALVYVPNVRVDLPLIQTDIVGENAQDALAQVLDRQEK